MVDNTKVANAPRGRPQIRPGRGDAAGSIVAAAREEFQASGYAGASMVRVAQRAGVSTKTMYRLIPTKADLFRSVVSDRISQFILEIDGETLDALPIEQALEHILIAYGGLTLDDGDDLESPAGASPNATAFQRSPAAFSELAIRRTTQTMEGWLERQRDPGQVADRGRVDGHRHAARDDDHGTAARLLLGQRTAPSQAEIAERARACAGLFLDGCRRDSSSGSPIVRTTVAAARGIARQQKRGARTRSVETGRPRPSSRNVCLAPVAGRPRQDRPRHRAIARLVPRRSGSVLTGRQRKQAHGKGDDGRDELGSHIISR